MTIRRSVVALITVLAFGVPAWAQDGAGAGTPAAGAPAAAAAGQRQVAPEDDPDLDIDPLQPDFTLIGLPTTLRMPRMKSAFRVTHRFTRSLGQGDFGSLASDFFRNCRWTLRYRHQTNSKFSSLFRDPNKWIGGGTHVLL